MDHNETSTLIENVDLDLSEDSNDNEDEATEKKTIKSQGHKNITDTADFTGYISSCVHGSGRSSTDRQFFYVNSRPCEPTKVIKLINEIYRQYNPNQYPFIFLNIKMESSSVDINLTPDKRKVFLIKEKSILNLLKNSLTKLFENIPRTLKIESSLSQCSQGMNNDLKPNIDQPRIFNSFLQQFTKKNISSNDSVSDKNTEKIELKRKATSMLDFISSKTMKTESSTYHQSDSEFNTELTTENNVVSMDLNKSDIDEHFQNCKTAESKLNDTGNMDNTYGKENLGIGELNKKMNADLENKSKEIMYLEFTDNLPNTQIRNVSDLIPNKSHTVYCEAKRNYRKENIAKVCNKVLPMQKSNVQTDQEYLGKNNRRSVILKTSIEHVKALSNITDETILAPKHVKFKSEINPVFNKKCEEELTREICKDSFKQMSVVGQFNLGFIITRLEDDLFIIDQHATDEIYNFEMLQKSTELISQKLVL